jgi:hypothetical protein
MYVASVTLEYAKSLITELKFKKVYIELTHCIYQGFMCTEVFSIQLTITKRRYGLYIISSPFHNKVNRIYCLLTLSMSALVADMFINKNV